MLQAKPSEEKIRNHFNSAYNLNAIKKRLGLGSSGSKHEYDLYDPGKVIGGINTSPWTNKTGSNNTGGQDRVSTELLWLTLWEGTEKRVLVLADYEMCKRIIARFAGCSFSKSVKVVLYDNTEGIIETIGSIP